MPASSLAVLGGGVDVVIRDGLIVDGPAAGEPVLDAAGCVVSPGFVDLQCNGAGGIHLTDEPERLWEVAALLPRYGVTAWLPTIVSSPADRVQRALAALAARPTGLGPLAEPLGLHLEGPFLNVSHRGAHGAEQLVPPEDRGWSRDGGVRLVTLAPELPGALRLARALVGRGVIVSAGHSGATVVEMAAAADAGVSMVTHLFNGMAPLHHREPGLGGLALSDERVHVGVIADGVHVHPVVVALAWRLLGERFVLVSDAVAALGTTTGVGAGVRLADGTLAGADVGMDGAVRNLVAFTGCSLADAGAAASLVPAAVLSDPSRGSLAPGARGDLVVLRVDGEVLATVVGGEVAHQ